MERYGRHKSLKFLELEQNHESQDLENLTIRSNQFWKKMYWNASLIYAVERYMRNGRVQDSTGKKSSMSCIGSQFWNSWIQNKYQGEGVVVAVVGAAAEAHCV